MHNAHIYHQKTTQGTHALQRMLSHKKNKHIIMHKTMQAHKYNV
jgi:hypothetical protein